MTTTDLIAILQRLEKGASGRSREISIVIENTDEFIPEPEIYVSGTGDGIAGAEITLNIKGVR